MVSLASKQVCGSQFRMLTDILCVYLIHFLSSLFKNVYF